MGGDLGPLGWGWGKELVRLLSWGCVVGFEEHFHRLGHAGAVAVTAPGFWGALPFGSKTFENLRRNLPGSAR